MLIDFMAKPRPYEAFAGLIDVSSDVLYDWEKAHPEFLQAKKRGRAKQQMALADLYFRGLTGELTVEHTSEDITYKGKGDKAIPVGAKKRTQTVNGFNVTAMIFAMKNMAGWKDRIEITEDDEVDSMDFDGGEE